MLAHRIAAAEKQTHDRLVEAKVYGEKIAVLTLQLAEAEEDQRRLVKRMKRQADAYRK